MPALEFASFHPPLAGARPFGSSFVALSGRTCLVATLATCLITVTLATPSVAAAAPTADEADNSSEAEAMFRRGQAKYETADYEGAIELWTEAYTLVGSSTENASIKALLIYNLAQAHLKAFDLDKDQIHLKQALQLLQSFRSNLTLLYDDQAALDEETDKVDGRIKEVEAMLAELEQPEPEPAPAPHIEPEQDPNPVDHDDHHDHDDHDGPSGTPLIAAGGTLVGLGALFGVVGVVGGLQATGANDISDLEIDDLQGREDRFGTGRAGNAMVIVGSVGAGVLVPTGIALIVVGVMRNKKLDRRGAALSPSFGGVWGGGAGLTISGRF